MENVKIVIEVKGGIVQAVGSNYPINHVDVLVIDHDISEIASDNGPDDYGLHIQQPDWQSSDIASMYIKEAALYDQIKQLEW